MSAVALQMPASLERQASEAVDRYAKRWEEEQKKFAPEVEPEIADPRADYAGIFAEWLEMQKSLERVD